MRVCSFTLATDTDLLLKLGEFFGVHGVEVYEKEKRKEKKLLQSVFFPL
jgi:hypothetical protein